MALSSTYDDDDELQRFKKQKQVRWKTQKGVFKVRRLGISKEKRKEF
jgi:hypothetical protein